MMENVEFPGLTKIRQWSHSPGLGKAVKARGMGTAGIDRSIHNECRYCINFMLVYKSSIYVLSVKII